MSIMSNAKRALAIAAAVATLNKGGRVYATSETVDPESQVAAIFRY